MTICHLIQLLQTDVKKCFKKIVFFKIANIPDLNITKIRRMIIITVFD